MLAIRQGTIPPLRSSAHSAPALLSLGTADRIYNLVAVDGPRPSLALRRHLPAAERLPRPLVIRARTGDRLLLSVTNRLASEPLSVALVDDDYGIQAPDSAAPLRHGETHTYLWHCRHAGIYPMYNRAAADCAQHRCLLGVLIVEPKSVAEITVP